jgi:cytochrome c-type biogenesis protein CcmH
MSWFWVFAGLLIAVALVALLRPLVRDAVGAADQSESVLAIYRGQLANIDNDAAQGRLPPAQAADAQAELMRRMLAAADQESRASAPGNSASAETTRRFAAAVGIAALLPAGALAIYFTVGAPAAIDQSRAVEEAAKPPRDRAELSAAADQLKARLQREPGHKEGWVLLGRALASLGRFAEAREAYGQAIALASDEPGLQAELGEVLVLAAGGTVTPEAEAAFARSANDPRARFYGAEAALQRGDRAAAKTQFQALLADAPRDAPWRKIVAERLAEIAPGEAPTGAMKPGSPSASAPSAGPTAQDVAAAQAMSPEERQTMIRGMVDRLAARLEQNPNDKEGWARLARAYDVLGEKEKAQAARVRADAASPTPAASAPSPLK